jgi:hypothetical protein
MATDIAAALREDAGGRLSASVRRVVGDEAARLVAWEVSPLTAGLGAVSAGVFRVAGTARVGSGGDDGGPRGVAPWAVVVKVVRAPAEGAPGAARALVEGEQEYWRREPLVYGSGLREELPEGLRAPRCFGVDEPEDGAIWVWLEDVRDDYAQRGERWPAARYVTAARHAGRLNGLYAVGRAMPRYGWLCADQLGSWCARFEASTRRALEPEVWEHPLLVAAGAGPKELAAGVGRLIGDRERLMAALERVPRTLCHQDYWRRNLFAVGEETVAVDWAFTGTGPLGAEAGTLVCASLAFGELDGDAARDVEGEVYRAYVAGLRETGWEGDERLVRLGYAAKTAVQWGTCPTWLGLLHDEKRHAWAETFTGRSMAEMAACWVAMTRLMLELGEEARCGIG